jgi:hypothetical protein
MVAPASTALSRLLDPVAQCLNRESAQRLADLKMDPTLQARVDDLADRANSGTLSDAEKAE